MKVEVKVRKDGAINLTANGRKTLGIYPGVKVSITIQEGKATIKPDAYVCPYCGGRTLYPLLNIGVCRTCDDKAAAYVRQGYGIDGALAKLRKELNDKDKM